MGTVKTARTNEIKVKKELLLRMREVIVHLTLGIFDS
jgi:hypothetical protein